MLAVAERKEREFFNYRESLIIDEQTWVAENLDAPLEKPLRYVYRDGELWSEQGQALGGIFSKSVEHYHKLATENPSLAFQYRRALAERREYEHMKAMARGDAPNTFVVTSSLPRELHGHTRGVLGYQPQRGLGFLRVMTREEGGAISMWTHSIDRTDDSRVVGAIYAAMGESVDWSRDVLEQPVALQINDRNDRQLLGDTLLRAADAALEAAYGGSWFAGRSDTDRREAVAFVMSQRDLLYAHVDALVHVGPTSTTANALRYDFAAAMRRRFEGNTQFSVGGDVAVEMASAGRDAARRGETADGCGLTIAANTTQELERAGYQTSHVEKPFVKGMCVACLKPAMVGGCGVCATCQKLSDEGVNLFDVRDRALKQKAIEEKMQRLQAAKQERERATPPKTTKQQVITAKFGAYARLKTVPVIGGADTFVYDYRSNELIQKL